MASRREQGETDFPDSSIGSRIPVLCIANSSCDTDSFADATVRNEPIDILRGIEEIMSSEEYTVGRSEMPGVASDSLQHIV